jgi:hypothetical protein
MCQVHRTGEKLLIDYAEATIGLTDGTVPTSPRPLSAPLAPPLTYQSDGLEESNIRSTVCAMLTSNSGFVSADSGRCSKSVSFARIGRSSCAEMTGHDAGITGRVRPEYPVGNFDPARDEGFCPADGKISTKRPD